MKRKKEWEGEGEGGGERRSGEHISGICCGDLCDVWVSSEHRLGLVELIAWPRPRTAHRCPHRSALSHCLSPSLSLSLSLAPSLFLLLFELFVGAFNWMLRPTKLAAQRSSQSSVQAAAAAEVDLLAMLVVRFANDHSNNSSSNGLGNSNKHSSYGGKLNCWSCHIKREQQQLQLNRFRDLRFQLRILGYSSTMTSSLEDERNIMRVRWACKLIVARKEQQENLMKSFE